MNSFDDKISANKNNFNKRLIDSVFKYQNKNNIENLEDFKNAIINEIGGKMDKGNAFISESNWLNLFEESGVREVIEENIGEEESKKMYGEVNKGQFEIHRTDGLPSQIAVTKISSPIIFSKGYTRKGRTVANYHRAKPVRFTEPQIKFLKALKPRLKQRKLTSNEIITKFNNRYKNQQKTSSSVKSKIYRM